MVFRWLKKIDKGRKHLNGPQPLSLLVNLLPGVYYRIVYGADAYIDDLAEGAFKLMGYKPEELIKKNSSSFLNLIHPDHKDILAQKRKLCTQGNRTYKLKYQLITKGGTAKLVEDTFIGQYDHTGKLIAMHGYIKEVKKSAIRSHLNSQLEAYRAAIDVNIIASVTDSNRRIIYVNENFKKVTKYSEHEILGKTHELLSSGYHSPQFVENLWQTISSGKMWQGEVHTRAKDGTHNWVETVIIPTFDENKKIISYLYLSILANERKQAEEQREKYISVLEHIAHVVAHDLRGPVCSIQGLVNIFGRIECPDPEVKQAIEYLFYAVKKLDEISRDLSARIYTADREMKGDLPGSPTLVSASSIPSQLN